jgi:hypothetical protein
MCTSSKKNKIKTSPSKWTFLEDLELFTMHKVQPVEIEKKRARSFYSYSLIEADIIRWSPQLTH